MKMTLLFEHGDIKRTCEYEVSRADLDDEELMKDILIKGIRAAKWQIDCLNES